MDSSVHWPATRAHAVIHRNDFWVGKVVVASTLVESSYFFLVFHRRSINSLFTPKIEQYSLLSYLLTGCGKALPH